MLKAADMVLSELKAASLPNERVARGLGGILTSALRRLTPDVERVAWVARELEFLLFLGAGHHRSSSAGKHSVGCGR